MCDLSHKLKRDIAGGTPPPLHAHSHIYTTTAVWRGDTYDLCAGERGDTALCIPKLYEDV